MSLSNGTTEPQHNSERKLLSYSAQMVLCFEKDHHNRKEKMKKLSL